jgi:uncharacterized membrane protein (UPF0127 family)
MRLFALRSAALLLFGALASASPVAAALPDCPNHDLATVPVTFHTAKGKFTYKLDVAATPGQQECGLMYRKAMPRDVGMDFPMKPPRSVSFWMENTVLPLDLVFVGPDNRVVSVGHGKPFSRDLIDSGGLTARVIELNAGEAARIGLKPGDRVGP